uniref:Cytochrome c oxidase subunit 2 n=1 Tax=Graffilla buccinicola TaxID=84095 RepID=A0A7G5XUI6_9PLAT|nr:cytochrome c oxidase subunit II [Graffilla buccinicola]QNA49621.1 cytochrome c oxidase subunit 2 [Graffilla buccinicola]
MYLFYRVGFVGPGSVVCQEEMLGHSLLLHLLVGVMSLVGGLLVWVWCAGGFTASYVGSDELETYWTIIPGGLVVSFLFPSLSVLYFIDCPDANAPNQVLKFVGHQWYWSFTSWGASSFGWSGEMYMVPTSLLGVGDFRLLEVDLPVPACYGLTRVVTSSCDVIHSVAVPAFGVKVDAVPGRLNQQVILLDIYGKFYGQCSEICGANHSFMPLAVEVVDCAP